MSIDIAKPGHRLWLIALIWVAAIGAVFWIQAAGELNRQRANMRSGGVLILAFALSLIWFFFLSRLSWRRRLAFSLVGLAVLLGFFSAFRYVGVTGDLLPVFELRTFGSQVTEAPGERSAQPIAVDAEALAGIADFGQFFGPNRDGRVADPGFARDWQAQPPQELWRREIGSAWSGFAVSGRRALTQEQRDDQELVTCYDLLTGELLWQHADPVRYTNPLAGVGPRATPTIEEERVYSMGATGILNCLELDSGESIWSRDTLTENDALLPEWGVACSPLLFGDQVVVSPGGTADRSLVAYDKADGEFVYGGGSSPAQWSSPVAARIAGVEQILIFNKDLVAHDAHTGKVLWTHDWSKTHPHVAMPVVLAGDRVLVSSGYGTGSELLQIRRGDDGGLVVEELWSTRRLKAKFVNLLSKDGFVYGLDDGIMTCIDLEDGSRRWKSGRYGHGQLLLVGELLIVTAETGSVHLLEADPEEHRELSSMEVFAEKAWNPPALAGQYLLLRNEREAVCFRLPLR